MQRPISLSWRRCHSPNLFFEIETQLAVLNSPHIHNALRAAIRAFFFGRFLIGHFQAMERAVTTHQAHPVNSGEKLIEWLGFIENQLQVSVAIALRDFQRVLQQFFNGPRIRLPDMTGLPPSLRGTTPREI